MKAPEIHPRHGNTIVIVGGSRIWDDTDIIYRHLTECCPMMVVTTQKRGAVSIVGDWCNETGVTHLIVPAPNKAFPTFATQLTNMRMVSLAQQLAETHQADLVSYLYMWGDSPTTRHLQQILTEHAIPTTVTEKPVPTPKQTHNQLN